jgi:hypothetical protein
VANRGGLRALALFFLAPFTGEFVLGNQALTALPSLLLLAPLYGGGAVLIREVGRRTRATWPVMGFLAVAYALVEEGLVDQMVFNPGYLGLPDFADWAEVPGLGISARLTVDAIALHAIVSTLVPIVLVEAFDPRPAAPWLRRRGLAVVTTVFVVGCVGLGVLQAVDLGFVGTWPQFVVTTAVVLGLVAAAAVRARRPVVQQHGPPAHRPRHVVMGVLAVTSGFWVVDLVVGGWVAAGGGALVLLVGLALLVRESHRPGWSPAHHLAAATGALATYLWLAPINTAQLGVPPVTGLAGNVLFGVAAVVLLALAWRAHRTRLPA